ncbi:MAG: hypothetical protein V2B18_21320 [Pseudomonadota bacterium]
MKRIICAMMVVILCLTLAVAGWSDTTYIPGNRGSSGGLALTANSFFVGDGSNLAAAMTLSAVKTLLSVDDLVTLSGVADGAVNLGAFSGSTITDNQTIKAALQLLEAAVEGASSFSVTDITGAADDSTPALTATMVLAQGGSLIESTIQQVFTAVLGAAFDTEAELTALFGGKQASDATLTALAALTLTEGCMITATGADAPTVVAKGSAYQTARMNAGATAPAWSFANWDAEKIWTAAPTGADLVVGKWYRADNDTWDPISYAGTNDYYANWTGTAWVGVWDIVAGTWMTSTFGNISSNGLVTGLMPSVVLTHSSGVHDGSNDQAIMTDSGESFTTSQFVGMTVYNITDGSSCTVTANDGTTITCTLAGGTQNDWDTNDVWQVGPGPYQSGSWYYVVAAGTIRHPATAGYTACYESDAAAVVTVDMASDSMIFQGTLDTAVVALDAGDCIDTSGSTSGDYLCIHNKSATEAQGKGKRGVLVDGGAS